MTVEENILKKANQKRLLGDLAIEGGNFTTAYFKSVSIGFRYFWKDEANVIIEFNFSSFKKLY
jgi:SNF2 family DNA or RNA helicase